MNDANKLVATYIKIRDARDAMLKRHEEEAKEINSQLEVVSDALLELCKETGQEGGKTPHGTFTRTVKTRYWTSNWPRMYDLIREFDDPHLLEQRVHQGNFKEFLKAHPDRMPEGMNVDSKYSIVVRKAKATTE